MSKTFHIGIDLGTSNTSIATSTGKRQTIATCVGYARDLIARKRFARDVLFGQEALDNRLALDMVWPLSDGVISEDEKAIKATRLILQNIVAEVLPEKQEDDTLLAAVGVPAQASLKNKKAILKASKGILDKVIIVSEPFAVAYSIDRFDECLIVDIGGGTTDLCRMHGSFPSAEDQLTLRCAGNHLDAAIEKAILEKYPEVQLSKKIVREIKERYGYVSETSDPVVVTLTRQGIPAEYDITELLRNACLELAQSISKAIHEMIASFDPDFQERLRNNIIIAGGGSRLKGIDIAIVNSLKPYGGGNAICVNDAEHCGSVGALKMCMEMPEKYWEKI